MIIRSGKGTSHSMGVNKEGRALTSSVTQPLDQHLNAVEHKVYSVSIVAADPAGANDYFFYYQNTGTSDVRLTDIRMRSTVVGNISIRGVTGTPSYTSDTDITPTNRTVGNTNTLTAVVKQDTDTTGLTSSGDIFIIRLDTADKEEHLRTTSNIIIPPGQKLAFLWSSATGVLDGLVSIIDAE